MRHFYISFILICTLSCSGNNQQRELSEFESEHGIGPVTSVLDLGSYDSALADRGRQIYATLCVMCHGQNDTDIAPTLDGVLDRRSPEYIMNMILNPTGMIRWHPTRADEKRYLTSMPYQSLSTEEARAIVEYLRCENGYRAKNVKDKPTLGGGFGLTKALYVTGQLNGDIWIDSEENVGTKIKIEIPTP